MRRAARRPRVRRASLLVLTKQPGCNRLTPRFCSLHDNSVLSYRSGLLPMAQRDPVHSWHDAVLPLGDHVSTHRGLGLWRDVQLHRFDLWRVRDGERRSVQARSTRTFLAHVKERPRYR